MRAFVCEIDEVLYIIAATNWPEDYNTSKPKSFSTTWKRRRGRGGESIVALDSSFETVVDTSYLRDRSVSLLTSVQRQVRIKARAEMRLAEGRKVVHSRQSPVWQDYCALRNWLTCEAYKARSGGKVQSRQLFFFFFNISLSLLFLLLFFFLICLSSLCE